MERKKVSKEEFDEMVLSMTDGDVNILGRYWEFGGVVDRIAVLQSKTIPRELKEMSRDEAFSNLVGCYRGV